MAIPIDVIMETMEHKGEMIDLVYSPSDGVWYLHRKRDSATSKRSWPERVNAVAMLVAGRVAWVTDD